MVIIITITIITINSQARRVRWTGRQRERGGWRETECPKRRRWLPHPPGTRAGRKEIQSGHRREGARCFREKDLERERKVEY